MIGGVWRKREKPPRNLNKKKSKNKNRKSESDFIKDYNTESDKRVLFLKYTLEFSTRMFIVFWTVTVSCFAVFLWFLKSEVWLGLLAALVIVINIFISRICFKRQLKRTRKLLLQILES